MTITAGQATYKLRPHENQHAPWGCARCADLLFLVTDRRPTSGIWEAMTPWNGACPKVFILVGRGMALGWILRPCRTLSLHNITAAANEESVSENKFEKTGSLKSVSSVAQALQTPGADRSPCIIGLFCRTRKRDIQPRCRGSATRCLIPSSSVSRPITLGSGGSDAAMGTCRIRWGRCFTRGTYVYTILTRMMRIYLQFLCNTNKLGFIGR